MDTTLLALGEGEPEKCGGIDPMPDKARAVEDAAPLVVLVGRPNVGKSSLFNRIIGRRKAIVDSTPGVTRDLNEGRVVWNGKPLRLVDTGGYDPIARPDESREIPASVWGQTKKIIAESYCVVVVVDGQMGVSPWDRELIHKLRKMGKPLILAVNKIDVPAHRSRIASFYELKVPVVFPVSAETGMGVQELMDWLTCDFSAVPAPGEQEELRIAVIGRPNVGKSSLVNRLLGTTRAIVDPTPGTTRDSLDTVLAWNSKRWVLVDTAGIRRRGRIQRGVERLSVQQAMRSIERAQVVLLMIDGAEGPTEQDARVAGYAYSCGKGVVVLVNKCDLFSGEEAKAKVLEDLAYRCHFLSRAAMHFVSAKVGTGVDQIFRLVEETAKDHAQWTPTGPLNRVIQQAVKRREPPGQSRGRLKVFYATQTAAQPPTFLIFVNDPRQIHFSYQRYLSNEIRSAFGLNKTPIRLFFRCRRQ